MAALRAASWLRGYVLVGAREGRNSQLPRSKRRNPCHDHLTSTYDSIPGYNHIVANIVGPGPPPGGVDSISGSRHRTRRRVGLLRCHQ
jgi:hypothetical protein